MKTLLFAIALWPVAPAWAQVGTSTTTRYCSLGHSGDSILGDDLKHRLVWSKELNYSKDTMRIIVSFENVLIGCRQRDLVTYELEVLLPPELVLVTEQKKLISAPTWWTDIVVAKRKKGSRFQGTYKIVLVVLTTMTATDGRSKTLYTLHAEGFYEGRYHLPLVLHEPSPATRVAP